MPFVQPVLRGVVDVQQDGIKLPPGLSCVEAGFWMGSQGKKVPFNKSGARIRRNPAPQRNQTGLVPTDDRLKKIDNEQRPHILVSQGSDCRVAKSETSDHDIHWACRGRRQPQVGQSVFHRMEKTAHQELPVEDDLIDNLVLQHGDFASSQDELSKRGAAEIEFLKSFHHSSDPAAGKARWRDRFVQKVELQRPFPLIRLTVPELQERVIRFIRLEVERHHFSQKRFHPATLDLVAKAKQGAAAMRFILIAYAPA